MRVNRIVFDKLKMEWEIAKHKTGVKDYFEEAGLSMEIEEEQIPMLDETMNEMFNEMLENASPELKAYLGLESEDKKEQKPPLSKDASVIDHVKYKIHETTESLAKAIADEDYLLASELNKKLDELKSDLDVLESGSEDM